MPFEIIFNSTKYIIVMQPPEIISVITRNIIAFVTSSHQPATKKVSLVKFVIRSKGNAFIVKQSNTNARYMSFKPLDFPRVSKDHQNLLEKLFNCKTLI